METYFFFFPEIGFIYDISKMIITGTRMQRGFFITSPEGCAVQMCCELKSCLSLSLLLFVVIIIRENVSIHSKKWNHTPEPVEKVNLFKWAHLREGNETYTEEVYNSSSNASQHEQGKPLPPSLLPSHMMHFTGLRHTVSEAVSMSRPRKWKQDGRFQNATLMNTKRTRWQLPPSVHIGTETPSKKVTEIGYCRSFLNVIICTYIKELKWSHLRT